MSAQAFLRLLAENTWRNSGIWTAEDKFKKHKTFIKSLHLPENKNIISLHLLFTCNDSVNTCYWYSYARLAKQMRRLNGTVTFTFLNTSFYLSMAFQPKVQCETYGRQIGKTELKCNVIYCIIKEKNCMIFAVSYQHKNCLLS